MGGEPPFPLWRTLGFPPREDAAPNASSPQWRAVVARLAGAMPDGVRLPRLRSWPALWALIHATPPPVSTTWGQLCGEASVDTIATKIREGAACPPFSCASWNARWVKASTPKAALKRQFVLDKVLAGQAVCLQETHWSEAKGYAWEGLFPASQVASSPAHEDGQGVTRGGVAVLVPHHVKVVSKRTLAPGCAVECCADYGRDGTRAFWSVYLPPKAQGSTLDLLWDARPPVGAALIVAGDFNIEMERPRTEEEVALRDRLFTWFGLLGVSPVAGAGHTRQGRKGSACIDAIAVPAGQAWRWRIAKAWRPDLSDHARIQVVAGHSASTGRACTPATIRSLPPTALVELRKVYSHLSLALGRPATREVLPGDRGAAGWRPYRPGTWEAPEDQPARGIACEGPCERPCHACGGGGECAPAGTVPLCPPPRCRRRRRGTLLGPPGPRPPSADACVTTGTRHAARQRDDCAPPPGGRDRAGTTASAVGLDAGPEGGSRLAWDPVMALFVGPFIEHAVKGWWNASRAAAPRKCSVTEELRAIAGCGATREVSRALGEWLRDHGETAEALTAAQATQWLTYAEHARRTVGLTMVPLRMRAPAAKRRGIAEGYRVGRAVHKPRGSLHGLRGADGQLILEPRAVDEALWNSRRELWGSTPKVPEHAGAILDAYFADRGAAIPGEPVPDLRAITDIVLAAGGSAPGHNAVPYEVYHQGAELVAEALGLAVLAAHHDPAVLGTMLGPNVDLLLWIPKKAGADRPDGQRPLQLPTCFRRLFGSVVTSMVAPHVEPHLSEWQAAVKGGSCRNNITRAYEHLGGHADPEQPERGPLWGAVLGEAEAGAEEACRQAEVAGLERCPAALLADQSKAFERIGLAWIAMVMDGWKFPKWVRAAFDALLLMRGVRACIGGVLGYVRYLERGLGMGNTPSPFVWCLGYDPIIDAVHSALGVRPPTYVDDLAALVWGPAQAMAVEIFLIAAGHAAGLHIDAHTCTTLRAESGARVARRVLGAFPAKVEVLGSGGAFRVAGMPGELARTLLRPHFDGHWEDTSVVERLPCHCVVKTQVIPSHRVRAWAGALAGSPFGASSVVERGPYLGAYLHCRARGALEGVGPGDWQGHAALGARSATWERAVGTISTRASQAEHAIGSHAQKAMAWNVYTLSVAYYPAQIAEPTRGQLKEIRTAARTMTGAGTAVPIEFLHAMNILMGAGGCPRCSDSAIAAAGLIAELRGGAWGPPDLSPGVGKRISDLTSWAEAGEDAAAHPSWASGDRECRRTTAELLRKWRAGALEERELGRAGSVLYRAVWRAGLCEGGGATAAIRAMLRKSRTRRWYPTQGEEWGFARYTAGFNTTFHVAKLLYGGTAPGPALRSRAVRLRHPRACNECGSADVAWSWVTDGPGHPGLQWCSECLGGIGHLAPWAWVVDDASAGEGVLADNARGAPLPPAFLRGGEWRRRTSHYGACPLCSMGEHGAEHLAIWCPAVAAAWARTGASYDPSPLRALAGERDEAACAARLLHQASFIASSIHRKTSIQWRDAADWIVQAMVSPDAPDGAESYEITAEGAAAAGGAYAVPAWEDTAGCGCWECDDAAQGTRPGRTAPGAPTRDGGPPVAPGHVVAAAAERTRSGQTIAAIRSRTTPAAWVPPGDGWWPPPRPSHPWEANACWNTSTCGRCGYLRAALVATRALEKGEEVRTPTGVPGHVAPPGEVALHVAFDGSSKGRATGAGAVLWRRGEQGQWVRAAEAAIGMPSKLPPVAAEAWGLSAAADLLVSTGASRRKVHISGDCPVLMRFCAEQGRLRVAEAQQVAERALARLATAGWECVWTLVPRKHNTAADAVAKRARVGAAGGAGRPGTGSRADIVRLG